MEAIGFVRTSVCRETKDAPVHTGGYTADRAADVAPGEGGRGSRFRVPLQGEYQRPRVRCDSQKVP
jgi:hypothetical protein